MAARKVTATERTIDVVSGLVTALLLGYLAWQAVTAPAPTAPEASVVGIEPGDGDRRFVEVELRNPGGGGFIEAIVWVECGDDPVELVFIHVPALARRTATAVCPASEGTPPVAVRSWIPA